MKLKIITVGKPSNEYSKIFDEFVKRSSRFTSLQTEHIKEDKNTEKKIIKKIGKSFCILLDEKGNEFTSQELADFFAKKDNQSIAEISLVIGGPNGHTDNVRARGDFVWSLSKLTFPHDLAQVVLVESIYRALTINTGHPYHRA